MNIREYYEKKRELEYLIAYNERIRCPRVAAKWQRELDKLEREYLKEYGGKVYERATDD